MPPAPIDLLQEGSKIVDRLRTYYRSSATIEPEPAISERTAFLCAVIFTAFYVAPFYLSPTLRISAVTSRDAPPVIRARVRAVGLTCIACTVLTVYVLAIYGHQSLSQVLRWTGIWPSDPVDVLRVLLLVVVLFTCSLYETLVVDGDWRNWSLAALRQAVWDSWAGYRNLIVAPASEEFVFRALTIPLFLLAETNPTRIVFVSPLVFGLAHLHHLVGFLQTRTPAGHHLPPAGVVVQGLVISLFQFAYTSLFGFFAAFVFLRTGNLYAVIVAHSFCNHLGLPRLWGRVGQDVQHESAPTLARSDAAGSKRVEDESHLLEQDSEDESLSTPLGIGWTVVYYGLVVLGSYCFYKLLFPLTESKFALADF